MDVKTTLGFEVDIEVNPLGVVSVALVAGDVRLRKSYLAGCLGRKMMTLPLV